MKKLFLVLVLVFIFLEISGCSNSKQEYSFAGEGKFWDAQSLLGKDLVEKEGKKYFKLCLKYKGTLAELNKMKRVSITQGTSSGTWTINLYDKSTKEEYIKSGSYEEEYEKTYGIEVINFQELMDNELVLHYPYYETIENDIVNNGGMNIQIVSSIDFFEKEKVNDQIYLKGQKRIKGSVVRDAL